MLDAHKIWTQWKRPRDLQRKQSGTIYRRNRGKVDPNSRDPCLPQHVRYHSGRRLPLWLSWTWCHHCSAPCDLGCWRLTITSSPPLFFQPTSSSPPHSCARFIPTPSRLSVKSLQPIATRRIPPWPSGRHPRDMRHQVAPRVGAAALLLAGLVSADPYTPKHEAGRCAFRGHCGKQSFFGKELPCVDNELAEDPDAELRKELVDLCGSKWSEGPVCCNMEQVSCYTR